jgi:centrosomal protein CEP135
MDQFDDKYVTYHQEGERNEMLDHFRSLSMEASALENNNHSLETEVQDARTQLRVANDRVTDVEQLLESKDTLIHSYERQVCAVLFHFIHKETFISAKAFNTTVRHLLLESLQYFMIT